MKQEKALLGLLLLFTLGFADPALAIRCGNKLVNVDDPVSRAVRYCPQPFWVERWQAPGAGYNHWESSPGYRDHGSFSVVTRNAYASDLFEAWYINFGPRRLMRRLVFRNGYLYREDVLDYGFNRAPKRRCKSRDLKLAGDTLVDIYLRCGPPDYDYTFPVTVYPKFRGKYRGKGRQYGRRFTIHRHVWTYHLRGQLDRELHFEDGKLVEMRTLRE